MRVLVITVVVLGLAFSACKTPSEEGGKESATPAEEAQLPEDEEAEPSASAKRPDETPAAKDLRAICEVVTKHYQSGPTTAELQVRIADEIDERLGSSGIRTAWEAVAAASADERYELMVRAAEYEGLEGWECPALKEYTVASARAASE